MWNRRDFFHLGLAASCAAQPPEGWFLIAHRGGVVDGSHAENSPGSIQAAIDRGYRMIEVDVRRTKDGVPILQHDPTFRRFYGSDRAVEDIEWAEVRRLKASPGGTSPLDFASVCAMCEGRMRLMLDLKGMDWPAEFYAGLARTMKRHGLLESAYALGGAATFRHFAGTGLKVSCNRSSLRQALEAGEDVRNTRYLFELASELNEESMELCRQSGIVPVAAINTFRYTQAKRDEEQGPAEDAARLKKLGVRHFQIDSRYDGLFLQHGM